MTKFALENRVIYAPVGTSRQMQMSGVVSRIYDPPPEGFPQWYDVTDDDGTVWRIVDEAELTKI